MWTQAVGERTIGLLKSFLPRLGLAAIILLVGHGLAVAARWVVQRMLRRVATEVQVFLGRLAYASVMVAMFLWALAALNIYAAAMTTVVGAVTLAVTLSSQDLARNFIAGVYLLIERPFRRGDRITIRTFTGRVSSLELRTTRLDADGDLQVMVPNTIVMSEIVTKHKAPPPAEGSGGPLKPGKQSG